MSELTACQRLDIIRHKGRPTAKDYIPLIFDDFFEMHGDRLFGDDGAVMGGIAYFKGIPVTVIAEVKGRDLAENQKCNFGMPHPEGYRKALRLARQAEKFQTPVISIILGEGGSGGALALAVCDELAMLENAIYSVISPRGFASILWKDSTREREACDIMKITAEDLTRLGVCDHIISEADGGAHNDPQLTAENISDYIEGALKRKLQKGLDELLEGRYNKFRTVGEFEESSQE